MTKSFLPFRKLLGGPADFSVQLGLGAAAQIACRYYIFELIYIVQFIFLFFSGIRRAYHLSTLPSRRPSAGSGSWTPTPSSASGGGCKKSKLFVSFYLGNFGQYSGFRTCIWVGSWEREKRKKIPPLSTSLRPHPSVPPLADKIWAG